MLDDIEELFQKGVELQKSGKVEVASQFYTAVLEAQPEHPDANHNMGVLAWPSVLIRFKRRFHSLK